MTDLEISKALALAIGWKENQISTAKISSDGGASWEDCCITVKPDGRKYGIPFWYTDWNVIGPIAEKYDAYPFRDKISRKWVTWQGRYAKEDTPQKAIALAVIGAKK